MIISTLDVKDLPRKKQIKIIFANEKNKVELDISITYDSETSKNIFHQSLKIKVQMQNICIEKEFSEIDAYKFLDLVKKRKELEKHLPKIAKIVLEEFERNSSVSIEDIYKLITDLLIKLIEKKDINEALKVFRREENRVF